MEDDDTSLASVIEAIRDLPLDRHAQEIGRLCVLWSRLEMSIALLLSVLLEIKDPVANNVVLGALDMRAKVRALLAMGFHKKPNQAWFVSLQKELNEIDNDLRNERNRVIHDYWFHMPDGAVHRLQMGAKFVNDQRDKKLLLANVTPISVGALIALTVRIAKAGGAIDQLRSEYERAPLPSQPTHDAPPQPRSPRPGRTQ